MSTILRVPKLPIESRVISNMSELRHLLDDGELRVCDMPTEIIMCRPDYFCIPSEEHEINAHMIGNTGMVNIPKAMEWWTKANLLLKSLCEVHVMDAAPRLNDMVFAANGASTFVVDGVRTAIISSMVTAGTC
ncbi:hypothetical protein HYT05_04845 [Candidatus Kaiserbacteria bacterium]|nr:hypothetical protein [Candidatus Kaiserbacteria bacterium]